MRLQATKGCSTMRFFKIALVDKTLTQFLILFSQIRLHPNQRFQGRMDDGQR